MPGAHTIKRIGMAVLAYPFLAIAWLCLCLTPRSYDTDRWGD